MEQQSDYESEMDMLDREYRYRHALMQKRVRYHRTLLLLSLFLSLVFFLSGFSDRNYLIGFIPFPQEASYLCALAFFLAFLGAITYMYVQGGLVFVKQSPDKIFGARSFVTDVDLNANAARIEKLESVVSELSERLQSFDLGNRDALIEETVGIIKFKAHQQMWGELSQIASKENHLSRALAPIEKEFEKSKQRLLAEIQALGKRGSVNLALGVVTTATALLILSSLALSTIDPEIYKTPDMKTGMFALWIFFVPKISLAVFVQVFSLFFLRLYKAGLSEIKYFQNEITNLELKYLGVVTSILTEDGTAISEAGKLLLGVERNHILGQGQTTVELEKHKLEQSSYAEVIKLLPKLFSKKSI